MPRIPARALLLASATIAVLAALTDVAVAAPRTVWLCKPGLRDSLCAPSLRTTRVTLAGRRLGVVNVRRARPRKVDCFYVYPTVSNQPTLLSTRRVDPELRSIVRYQAARFSQHCRLFAPVYRQFTVASLFGAATGSADPRTPYRDVRNAWRNYLRDFNHGRGVVILGHSQGSFLLRRLISDEIDGRPAVRRRLVSAILLGGDVRVKRGKDAGGDFEHIRACRSARQLGCVVAYSTYDETPPQASRFGRAPRGSQVLCTNPAALSGGSRLLHSIYPTEPFAPGFISAGIALLRVSLPTASTPWIGAPRSYRARCSSAGGANVLRVAPVPGSPDPRPSPDATWGLHLADVNIALGNLVALVRKQAARYAARAAARRRRAGPGLTG